MTANTLSTRQKALKINLDARIYGTLAEIGAGQEVARHFFQAGAASGTIAKSMSAYDKIFSDVIYGKEKSNRYVSEERLIKMLEKEYEVLEERLGASRPPENLFFSFSNTVSAINYFGTNESHGWIGIRYQLNPKADFNQIVLHVRMLDKENTSQQHALGVLGVNLIFAAFYEAGEPDKLLESLMDNLSKSRIEINMIRMTGVDFKQVDNRLLNLQLVRLGLTNAVMFDQKGHIVLASEELYKKNVLVVRGSYRPPTLVSEDIIETGMKCFSEKSKIEVASMVTLCEITMTNLSETGEISREDFLARVDLLSALGHRVLISNYHQYFKLSDYFAKFKCPNLGLVLGIYNFQQIFDHDYNNFSPEALKSLGIKVTEEEEIEEVNLLASVGLLFKANVKVFVYPYHSSSGKTECTTLENLKIREESKHLINYLKETKQLFDIQGYNKKITDIYSRRVLEMIQKNEKGWEDMVPKSVAKTINAKCLFGHPCDTK
ncbi:MAG: hypothetical protein JNM93_06780 [Bacteriovoracaceae bacterium]|nr:hypothetical protein [Bacteriovoracaceae bacterium]